MTIAEKSTELGIDLAQIALEKYGVSKCVINDAFHCFTTKGGDTQNIYISDAEYNQVHDGFFRWHEEALAENSTLAQVETAFKAFIDVQDFVAMPSDVIVYEDLV